MTTMTHDGCVARVDLDEEAGWFHGEVVDTGDVLTFQGQTLDELKTALGLDHYEGRTFTGWHRHVTLVTAAQLVLILLRTSPEAAAPA